MKVKELILQLQQLNPENEINIHLIRDDVEHTCKNIEYVLAEPTVIAITGWHGLCTIELGETVGEG